MMNNVDSKEKAPLTKISNVLFRVNGWQANNPKQGVDIFGGA
jgi:hypothetical protein